jgi:hypothetical protein
MPFQCIIAVLHELEFVELLFGYLSARKYLQSISTSNRDI